MATYTDVDSVIKLLNTRPKLRQGGTVIDSSRAYLDLQPKSTNTGTISLSRVNFDDSYAGISTFKITFTDTTAFDAVIIPDGNSNTTVPIGSGTSGGTFTAVNPWTSESIYTLLNTYWSGLAVAGDIITWRSNSVISREQIGEVIVDAEWCIDSGLLRSPKVTQTDRTQLMFTAATLAGPLGVAVKYLAAFMVYQIIHPTAKLVDSEVFQWFQKSNNLVDQYIESLNDHGPEYISRAPLIPMSPNDKLGTPIFGLDVDWEQNMIISIEDVLSRIDNYTQNTDYRSYSSATTDFP